MSMTTTGTSTPAMSVFWDNVKTILYALALAMVLRVESGCSGVYRKP